MGEILEREKPVIQVRKLRKEYIMGQEKVVALRDINLTVYKGEICCIFGTSGSGKSTLLNQLAGLEKPTTGQVRIGGVPVSHLDENQLAAFRQQHRLCLSVLQPASRTDSPRKCGNAAHVPRHAQGCERKRSYEDAGKGRTEGQDSSFSGTDVRWSAAESRNCKGIHHTA